MAGAIVCAITAPSPRRDGRAHAYSGGVGYQSRRTDAYTRYAACAGRTDLAVTVFIRLCRDTIMASAPALMAQERLFLDMLQNVRRFDVRPDGALVLQTDDRRTITARR
jgi:hypothetical protein